MKKFNLIKQSGGITLATVIILILSLAARVFLYQLPASVSCPADMPLGNLLDSFAVSPTGTFALNIILTLINAIILDSIIVRYSICTVRTFLPISLYFIFTYTILSADNPLSFALFQLALILASLHAIDAFRRSYQFQNVFISAFFLGLLPLIFSSAIFLLLLLPTTLFLYHRTVREAAVALAGVLTPWLLCASIWWVAGYEWNYCFVCLGRQLYDSFAPSASFKLIAALPLTTKILAALFVLLYIISIFIILRNFNESKSRLKKTQTHFLWITLFGLLPLLFAPGIIVTNCTLAVSGTVIITAFFSRHKGLVPLLVFSVLVLLALAVNLPLLA